MKTSRNDAALARTGPRRGRPKVIDSPPKTRSSPSRSPARKRRASPISPAPAPASRSPGRRSPARRSPARSAAAKIPAKKSPSRATESSKSPSRRAALRSDEAIEIKSVQSLSTVRISRPRRSEYSIKDLSVGFNQVEMSVGDRLNGLEKKEKVPRATVAPQMIRRTSARLRDSASQPSGSSRVSESASRSLDLPLDEDSQDEYSSNREKSTSASRKLATPMRGFSLGKGGGARWEFGGRYGSAVLLLLLPTCVFSVLIACAHSCEFHLPQLALPNLSTFFSTKSVSFVTAQVLIQTVLSTINIFGRQVDRGDESGTCQYFNGLFASFVTIIGVFAAHFFKVLSVKVILDEYLRMAILFYVLAILLAVWLHIKSRNLADDKLNPYGNSGYMLYDFWMGREIFPQLGRIDVKVLLHRIRNVNGLILSLLLLTRGISLPQLETLDVQNYKLILSNLNYSPTILAIASMQLIYFLNLIINEHKVTSTFTWQSEGVGYMQTVSCALYPFYFLVISKFVVENRVSLSTNVLISCGLLYVVGLFIYSVTNNIKYEFRKNPAQKKLKHSGPVCLTVEAPYLQSLFPGSNLSLATELCTNVYVHCRIQTAFVVQSQCKTVGPLLELYLQVDGLSAIEPGTNTQSGGLLMFVKRQNHCRKQYLPVDPDVPGQRKNSKRPFLNLTLLEPNPAY